MNTQQPNFTNTLSPTKIANLLINTHSQLNNIRSNAELELQNLTQQYFPQMLFILCNILSSPTHEQHTRVSAGLYIKNILGGESARTTSKLQQIRERWHTQLSPDIRQQIKQQILHVLQLPNKEARNTAANIIANLVAVETLQQWKELIPNLLTNALQMNSNVSNDDRDHYLNSVLLCMGRIAESSATHEELQPHSSQILQVIAQGMGSNNLEVQATAMLCLYHMMDFISTNMEERSDRDVILQMICIGATNMSNNTLRLYSMMSITRLCELYYHLMPSYMKSLFTITKDSIEAGVNNKETVEITKQAIEVWSVTAEVEVFIDSQNANGNDSNSNTNKKEKENKNKNYGFVELALPTIIPLYLQALKLDNGTLDDDEYGIRKTAAVSLELFAHVTKDKILKEVLSFVEKNITANDWHAREAALLAFGYILNGPSLEQLLKLVSQILPIVLHMMQDSSEQVKVTASWTCGRICLHVPQAIQETDILNHLIRALQESNNIASKASWSIASLADYYSKMENKSLSVSIFSEAKKTFLLMTELLSRCEREDSDSHLISGVYESLNSIMFNAPAQANEMIKSVIPELVNRLKRYTNKKNKLNNDMYRLSSILTTISVSINVAGTDSLNNTLTNDIISCCCTISQIKNELVFEEMLSCIAAVATAIGPYFFTYLESMEIQSLFLHSINISAGQNNTQLCTAGASSIGDAFRTCCSILSMQGPKAKYLTLQSFTDEIVNRLLQCLLSTELELVCKPFIMDALVDVCLALGKNSVRYIHRILAECLSLGGIPVDTALETDEDMYDLLNTLRESIVGVCRSTFLEFSLLQNVSKINEYVPALMVFFKIASVDCNDAVLGGFLQLLDEMADMCELPTIESLRVSEVTNIFDKAKNSENCELGLAALNAFKALKARS